MLPNYRGIFNDDRNLNDLSLPIKLKANEEYSTVLKQTFGSYIEQMNRPAFARLNGVPQSVERTCKLLLRILDLIKAERESYAEKILANIICEYSAVKAPAIRTTSTTGPRQ